MKSTFNALLLTAREIAIRLKRQAHGTRLRIRLPSRGTRSNTGGWSVVVGDLGANDAQLQVWLDKFSGHPERKLYAGFCSRDGAQIEAITSAVSKRLWPIRKVTDEETEWKGQLTLTEPIRRHEFNAPYQEDYPGGLKFYGMYDPTRHTEEKINLHFCARAVAFFEDVARALPGAQVGDSEYDVYPAIENRQSVQTHLRRERSKTLALNCKERDDFTCQICGFRFEGFYGKLGKLFAEAHHIIPLSKCDDVVKTTIDDLITVCANCHRMLHLMKGEPGDIKKLRTIVRRHST